MEFNFSTPAGWQKFLTYAIGIVATILIGFGVSQAKVDVLVSVSALAIPVILTVVSLVFNQMAAAGKAKTELAKIQAVAAATVATNGIKPTEVVTEAPKPVEIKPAEPVVVPFDKAAFMDEVNKTTEGRYTLVNPATTFYNASQIVFPSWKFDNTTAWQEAKDLLKRLCGDYFKSVWGATYDEANLYLNDPLGRGCLTCTASQKGCTYPNLKYKAQQLGEGYYKALLEYESAQVNYA